MNKEHKFKITYLQHYAGRDLKSSYIDYGTVAEMEIVCEKILEDPYVYAADYEACKEAENDR